MGELRAARRVGSCIADLAAGSEKEVAEGVAGADWGGGGVGAGRQHGGALSLEPQ